MSDTIQTKSKTQTLKIKWPNIKCILHIKTWKRSSYGIVDKKYLSRTYEGPMERIVPMCKRHCTRNRNVRKQTHRFKQPKSKSEPYKKRKLNTRKVETKRAKVKKTCCKYKRRHKKRKLNKSNEENFETIDLCSDSDISYEAISDDSFDEDIGDINALIQKAKERDRQTMPPENAYSDISSISSRQSLSTLVWTPLAETIYSPSKFSPINSINKEESEFSSDITEVISAPVDIWTTEEKLHNNALITSNDVRHMRKRESGCDNNNDNHVACKNDKSKSNHYRIKVKSIENINQSYHENL